MAGEIVNGGPCDEPGPLEPDAIADVAVAFPGAVADPLTAAGVDEPEALGEGAALPLTRSLGAVKAGSDAFGAGAELLVSAVAEVSTSIAAPLA